MLERAQAFAEKLLAENARLRRQLAAQHAGAVGGSRGPSPSGPSGREAQLEAELAAARAELVRLSSGAQPPSGGGDVARQLAELQRRHAELEEQNENLANLYVASYQLHSSLDFKEVLGIVAEIVINLIGAEQFCILLLDSRTNELATIVAEGLERVPSARIKVGDGPVGLAAQSGEAWYRPASETGDPDLMHPLAAVPLKIKEDVIGMISVLRLLPHKQGFTPVDFELFNLLAGHAATAIFSAKLYSESERKLTTIQSFLNLLTTS